MSGLLEQLQGALAGRYRLEREVGAGGMAPGTGPGADQR